MTRLLIISLLFSCSFQPVNRADIKEKSLIPLSKQLKPFSSDGCSHWPEGTKKHPGEWLSCCFYHDIAYWIGGSEEKRKKADSEFKSCIEDKNISAAFFMHLGVRNLGSAEFRASYSWGYGWTYERGYIEPNERELTYALSRSPRKGEPLRKYMRSKELKEMSFNAKVYKDYIAELLREK